LSWKEEIDPPKSFAEILSAEIKKLEKNTDEQPKSVIDPVISRLQTLKTWYEKFTLKKENKKKMFHPYMNDIVGNTICADLLDYLPRDRQNLGMEVRAHSRLHRFLTIRPCSLHGDEDLRVSIMVTRKLRGGQRPDVATAVLDIMYERYEMAERVYYHHKKAAASAMLAKLAEICPDAKPDDTDATIYPAPWNSSEVKEVKPSNILHFSDDALIEHLGASSSEKIANGYNKEIKRKLYLGLKYDRNLLYETLLVIDPSLVRSSSHPISFFAKDFRGTKDKPSNAKRIKVENELAAAANVQNGEVIIYCPSPDMQSKEVDARLEIVENRILPLRIQSESFTYHADIKVLEQYYQELWRVYIFVSPRVFSDIDKCQAIVDMFIKIYHLNEFVAYSKVRHHDLKYKGEVAVSEMVKPLHDFLEGLQINDIPKSIFVNILKEIGHDEDYLKSVKNKDDLSSKRRINSLINIVILLEEDALTGLNSEQKASVARYKNHLRTGKIYFDTPRELKEAARTKEVLYYTFSDWKEKLLDKAIHYAAKR
jgi:hypothetical protein